MPDFEHFVPGVTAALAVGIALKSKETTILKIHRGSIQEDAC
jgi:hypothetical protein